MTEAARTIVPEVRRKMKRALSMALLLLLLSVFAAGGAGCASQQDASPFVSPPELPSDAADQTSPLAAVRSYLTWMSYAYRVGNSDVASNTMTPEEGVRVDSYIQLNKEKGRRIHQVLVSFVPRQPSAEPTRTALAARETWEYRYLSADGSRAISETYTASYETTYHVVVARPETWLVDSVDARPLGEVK